MFKYRNPLLFLFLYSPFILGNPIGKVALVKGQATMLLNDEGKVVKLEKGAIVSEEDSILTEKRSFVKVSFNNGSSITVSPNSKIEVREPKLDSKGIAINLIKGMVRSKITKKKKVHYQVNTRTASLGVRGTEFVSIYNQENKVTTSITTEGVVAVSELNGKGSDSVLTRAGEFSSVNKDFNRPVKPLRMAPDQLAYLRLSAKVEPGTVITQESLEREYQAVLKDYEGIPPAKTSFLPEGGYIDLITGLYVFPDRKDLTYNSKLKMFLPKKIGRNLSSDGGFRPKAGYIVHAKYGLVKEANLAKLKGSKVNFRELYEGYNKSVPVERKRNIRLNP